MTPLPVSVPPAAAGAGQPAIATRPGTDADHADAPGPILLHASAVAFGPAQGVAIIGPAGAGKSTLAMLLISAGAQLLGDDRLHVFARDGAVFARPPHAIAGLIERRGLGILHLCCLRLARLRLIIDLSAAETTRLPPPTRHRLCGINLPCLRAPVTGPAGLATFPLALRQYMAGAVMEG